MMDEIVDQRYKKPHDQLDAPDERVTNQVTSFNRSRVVDLAQLLHPRVIGLLEVRN